MRRAVWYVYRLRERLLVSGQLGLVLIVSALLAYVFWVCPLQQQWGDLQQKVNAPSPRVANQPQQPARLLQQYLESLPLVSQRASATQQVIDLAEQQGLVLDEVSYKTDVRQDDPLAHYHMRYSLYASYPEIQRFLSQLLHDLNYVAIESLSISRESAKDDLIEAQIDMVLHFSNTQQEPAHDEP